MPATLTSVADPNVHATVTHHGYPQLSRVRDVTVRMYDDRDRPEVHRGTTSYRRWQWSPVFPYRARDEAEALDEFLAAIYGMGDARFVLEMPAVVGSTAGPWMMTVECVNPEVVQDLASQRSATVIALELVEVDG